MSETSELYPHYTTTKVQKKQMPMNPHAMTMPSSSPPPPTGYGPRPLLLGPTNTLCECPFCNADVKTSVQYTTTPLTHIAAAICCLACCLCCVPYSSDSAKNADHYCPNCRRYLGTYRR